MGGNCLSVSEPSQSGQPVVRPSSPSSILVTTFPFSSRGDSTISIDRGDALILVGEPGPDWVCVRNMRTDEVGLVPKTCIAAHHSLDIELWYAGDIKRSDTERLLLSNSLPKGAFLVRLRETEPGQLALSVKNVDNKTGEPSVCHYIIRQLNDGRTFITSSIMFPTLKEMIEYYCRTIPLDGKLCCQLSIPCPRYAPREWDLSPETHKTNEVPREHLKLITSLGEGYFAEVWHAKYRDVKDVAVKMLKVNSTMSKEQFLKEAKMMKECRHDNLVSLFGVCSNSEPVYIITEFMKNGDLLKFFDSSEGKAMPMNGLIDMCAQVANGMTYLESKHVIHRDLAARNVLVGEKMGVVPRVRVADFGLAKVFDEDVYNSDAGGHGQKLPIKWTAPEALFYKKFSIKSDVWSFGILLYEVITRGATPYPGLSNEDVVNALRKGYRMKQPLQCPSPLYEIMKRCWAEIPENRDTFEALFNFIDDYFVSTGPTYMPGG